MLNALLIGCGNIGAMYDIDDSTDKVLTHAKAYHLLNNFFSLTVTDINPGKVNIVKNRYQCQSVEIENIDYHKYDVISLATPTQTHYTYLSKLLTEGVPLIICEKPVSDVLGELIQIQNHDSRSRIIVNYIRRFNPKFALLQKYFEEKLTHNLKRIDILYCRGYMNNCSHALDLVEFLTNRQIYIRDFNITRKEYDSFENDPTISGSFNWDDVHVSLEGRTGDTPNVFEVKFYFEQTIVEIVNQGSDICVYDLDERSGAMQINSKLLFRNVLDQHMLDVLSFVLRTMDQPNTDNFASSLRLNIEMINAIRRI